MSCKNFLRKQNSCKKLATASLIKVDLLKVTEKINDGVDDNLENHHKAKVSIASLTIFCDPQIEATWKYFTIDVVDQYECDRAAKAHYEFLINRCKPEHHLPVLSMFR